MGKVYIPVSEFVPFAYGGDVELRGFTVCASQLVVWSSYMSECNVDVWDIREHDQNLCVRVETDCECMVHCSCDKPNYDGPSILSDPKETYKNVPTAHDYLNLALVYS